MMPILLPQVDAAERSRLLAVDTIRRRALKRLYERKSVVDHLIQSLESYQECESVAPVFEFSAVRKCS